jgi:hypothetical protein
VKQDCPSNNFLDILGSLLGMNQPHIASANDEEMKI